MKLNAIAKRKIEEFVKMNGSFKLEPYYNTKGILDGQIWKDQTEKILNILGKTDLDILGTNLGYEYTIKGFSTMVLVQKCEVLFAEISDLDIELN